MDRQVFWQANYLRSQRINTFRLFLKNKIPAKSHLQQTLWQIKRIPISPLHRPEKASTTTPNRKEKDYAFLINRYKGCRNGAASGLRHCDIDLENKTITFTSWEKVVTYKKIRDGKRRENHVRRLKTSKVERTIPISTKLYESIKDIPLNNGSDDDSWGHYHSNEYRNNMA